MVADRSSLSTPSQSPAIGSGADRHSSARRRAQYGEVHPADWHPEHQDLPLSPALAQLEDAPPIDRVVVCQTDVCAPNTSVTDEGTVSGHVDLGALGKGDRWADLAVATWSTTWNYGPDWTALLLESYGVEPDPERIRYYRLLWDLAP